MEQYKNTHVNQASYYFITYGDGDYSIQRKRISFQAKKFEIFKKVLVYKKSSLSKDFKKRYANLLLNPRGSGFWIWKSQIILQTFEKMNKNDILIYVDSGSTLNLKGKKRLIEYFEILNSSSKSLMLFEMDGNIEKCWTSSQIFEYFDVQNDKNITDSNQYMGGIILSKYNDESKKFFQDFQEAVDRDNNLITDFYLPNQGNYFKACRHDQSILSVMGKINNCLSIKDESYYFENPNDQYSSPILTVRDGKYNIWQKLKFYFLYPINIRKEIYFKEKPFYFKNKQTVYRKIYSKFFNKF